MESNWRWNVYRYGVSNDVYRLVARGLGVYSPFLFAALQPGSPFYAFTFQFLPSEFATNWQVVLKPPGHPHFPYGYPVEPD